MLIHTALKEGEHVTGKKGNWCLDLSDVILCGRKRQMFEWKAVWRGGRERSREGFVSHMSFIFLYHDECQGFSVCLDDVETPLYSNPELTGHKSRK